MEAVVIPLVFFGLVEEENPQREPGPGERLLVSPANANYSVSPSGVSPSGADRIICPSSLHFSRCSDFQTLSFVAILVIQSDRINNDVCIFFSLEASHQFDPLLDLLFKKLNFTIYLF